MKKKALLSSLLTIALCISLIAGATFALFTSESKVNVAVTAGKVDVVATVENLTLGTTLARGNLPETSATENNNIITLDKIVPGDYVTFDIRIHNNSDVAVQYRTVISKVADEGLWDGLVVTFDEVEYEGTNAVKTEWAAMEVGSADVIVSVKVSLPENAGNMYQQTSCSFAYTVEAVQGNAEMPSEWNGVTKTSPTKDGNGVYQINTAAEFVSFITTIRSGNTAQYTNQSVVLNHDIDLGGYTIVTTAEQGNRTADGLKFDAQGHTVSNFTLDSTANPEGYYGGLFGYLAGWNTAYIKNLTVRNATVIGGKQTGVVVGGINNTNSSVENCKVYDCTVIGTKKVGSVVGYTANGIVKDCYAESCSVYCAENDANECGEVIGFINTVDSGCIDRTENNTFRNVNLIYNASYIANGVMLNNGVYEISNAQGLKYCATAFTRSDNTLNKTFKLTADVDMTGIEWTPWCNEAQYFNGLFDGQNHTIRNLTITDNDTSENGHAVGFIGRLGSNGLDRNTIQNVKFENANVSGHHWVGVAVGYNEFGKVDNVHVTNSKVTATCATTNPDASPCGDKAGALIGICGPNASYITVNDCSATGCEVKAARDAAQLIGYGYAGATFTGLSATGVTVTVAAGNCAHSRAGVVSANALIGNGTAAGLTLN